MTELAEIAAVVSAAWQEVLRRDDFGADDDFIEMGATSLDAVRIVARVSEDLDLDLSVRVLLEPRTLTGMVDRVRQEAAAQAGAST
ncbi:hypothetical protein Rhe02_15200 [Rhizocola hellebori]|uniref:Carrier domain-containing protein n=1 Tax=Rhizocola hellebori TaxID=1392758 RepID=A0A8J3Q3W0_9ACTN|nr:phosphopantetheine-binding protein [Rhizocola hellebori]GIH03453.1 hypothetical protein Rhe02_15200 [Rhizocola hellebori]